MVAAGADRLYYLVSNGFYDGIRFFRVIDGFMAKQTESPIVRLTIKVTGPATLKNVIVSDLLPAGMEIENPRLNPDAMPGRGIKDAITPAHLEIRDDRLVLAFDELTPGEHHFYYLARAVTPDNDTRPEAECMYDAAIRGRLGVRTLDVAK